MISLGVWVFYFNHLMPIFGSILKGLSFSLI
jgi:hypothetical protein